ncbi:hypothetical protein QFC21_003714 [Naganishia friedmannii]|uniref:Uncharacterized protein n=1 Tax=Naganishia friedmannii TaxID=89922 RepID=A0ACC2VNF6_9TREE|nr:hypothetical protein QFC21_003714 [Naganishia friedmannii]
MDFDWAAWHKKFEDFGLSTTKSRVDGEAKFPGSFPEDVDTGTRDVEEVKETEREGASSSSSGSGEPFLPGTKKQQSASTRGWKEEFDEEAADPVWKEHLDKLQATGKLKERDGQYNSTDPELPNGAEREEKEETEAIKFSFDELQDMLTEAETLRKDGNELYKSGIEIDYEAALETYQRALGVLPETSISRARTSAKEKPSNGTNTADNAGNEEKANVPVVPESGLVELTDEQAAAIEQEEQRKRTAGASSSEAEERSKDEDQILNIEGKIEEIKGFLYGNISAVYVALNKDTEAVEAASKYYKCLLASLPHNDSRLPQIRRAVSVIPSRIEQAGKAEMEAMMSQMKEWGDSVLGWFGMKCDDFKTETQPDGSTSININKSG